MIFEPLGCNLFLGSDSMKVLFFLFFPKDNILFITSNNNSHIPFSLLTVCHYRIAVQIMYSFYYIYVKRDDFYSKNVENIRELLKTILLDVPLWAQYIG